MIVTMAISFEQLLRAVQTKVYSEPILDAARSRTDADQVGTTLVEGFAKRFVECDSLPSRFASAPPERPLALPLARHQAQTSRAVTNLRHQLVQLNDLARHLVRLADGQRNREELIAALADLVAQGELVVNTQQGDVRSVLENALRPCLEHLAQDALLCTE
jgi:hypothetical protein